jgi:hypothetical protein
VLGSGFDFWLLAVPIIAYAILLCSYFDFVRPTAKGSHEFVYQSTGGA